MRSGERILVTGSGGLAGVNFVRALRASKRNYYIVGTDFNKYHIVYPDVDARYLTPRHSDPSFLTRISAIVKKERIDFLHPQPSSEAYVITSSKRKIGCRFFLPGSRVMEVGQDKLRSQQVLARKNVPVAKTRAVSSIADVKEAFEELALDLSSEPGAPLWVRARHGAGGGSAFSAAATRRPCTGWSSGSSRARP